jgi:hypothetical protein
MNVRIIRDLIDRNDDKLKFHKEEFERTLKTELCNLNYFSTTSIENLITFLTRLQSGVGKCEGKKQDLEMLYNYISIIEESSK